MVTLVCPRVLDDVISVIPAIRPNWRSSGVATAEAMVSGLAPGKDAPTEMVGKSTCGSADTGRSRKAAAPAKAMPTVKSVVAIGLRMKGSEMFTDYSAGTGAEPGLLSRPRVSRLARRSNQR